MANPKKKEKMAPLSLLISGRIEFPDAVSSLTAGSRYMKGRSAELVTC